ncbi:MAG: hypothetical protein LH606_11200, partial [Cytophagaceae bacterium]|nr:hypothetical protein [Cytophagaceae bacterium]
MVLYDEIDKSRRVTNALIIENKIYATVYNDLNDYFTDVPLNLENNGQKLGVVLTLKPIKLDSRYANQYVNITHAELLGRVRETIGVQLLRATDRYQLLLQDFFANIFNLYTPTHMDESVKFYYDYATRIKELLVLDKHVEVQVINAIQREVELLGFLVNRNNTFELTLRFEAYPEVLTYLKFNDLLEKQKVIVTMWSEGRKKEAWLRLPNLQVLAQGN